MTDTNDIIDGNNFSPGLSPLRGLAMSNIIQDCPGYVKTSFIPLFDANLGHFVSSLVCLWTSDQTSKDYAKQRKRF